MGSNKGASQAGQKFGKTIILLQDSYLSFIADQILIAWNRGKQDEGYHRLVFIDINLIQQQ